jgi:hypothetical protein
MNNFKKVFLLAVIFVSIGCSFLPQEITEEEKITNEAISELDETICTEIKDKNNMDNCFLLVKDEVIKRKAINEMHPEYCKEISDAGKRAECDRLLVEEQEKIKKMESYQADHEKMLEIIGSRKVEDCSTLQKKVYRRHCEINIYMMTAQLSRDPSICEKIDSAELIWACKNSL